MTKGWASPRCPTWVQGPEYLDFKGTLAWGWIRCTEALASHMDTKSRPGCSTFIQLHACDLRKQQSMIWSLVPLHSWRRPGRSSWLWVTSALAIEIHLESKMTGPKSRHPYILNSECQWLKLNKHHSLVDWIKKQNPSIYFLEETHLTKKNQEKQYHMGFVVFS